jgi:HEAT repeat protein
LEGSFESITNDVILLTTFLDDKQDSIRLCAAIALGNKQAAARQAAGRLAELCRRDPQDNVRIESSVALVFINDGDDDAVNSLVSLIEHGKAKTRIRAASALERCATYLRKKHTTPVVAFLRDPDSSELRSTAAAILCKMDAEADEAVPALIEALGDNSIGVRLDAVVALGHVGRGSEAAVAALSRLLKGNEKRVRRESARVLGTMGSAARGSLPDLIDCLADKEVCLSALRAVLRIDSANKLAIKVMLDELCDPDPNIRAEAARVVSDVELVEGAVEARLNQMKRDQDINVRNAVEAALSKMRRLKGDV